MATPKLYYYEKRRGEAEAIRFLFKELGQVRHGRCCHASRVTPSCMQAFEDKPVSEAMLRDLQDAGFLTFNQLPMVEYGDFRLVEGALRAAVWPVVDECDLFTFYLKTYFAHTAAPAILEHIAYEYDTKKKPSPKENAYTGRSEEERSIARSLCSAVRPTSHVTRSLSLLTSLHGTRLTQAGAEVSQRDAVLRAEPHAGWRDGDGRATVAHTQEHFTGKVAPYWLSLLDK